MIHSNFSLGNHTRRYRTIQTFAFQFLINNLLISSSLAKSQPAKANPARQRKKQSAGSSAAGGIEHARTPNAATICRPNRIERERETKRASAWTCEYQKPPFRNAFEIILPIRPIIANGRSIKMLLRKDTLVATAVSLQPVSKFLSSLHKHFVHAVKGDGVRWARKIRWICTRRAMRDVLAGDRGWVHVDGVRTRNGHPR